MKEVQENMQEDSIVYSPFDETTVYAFDEDKMYFNNTQYPREDTEATYRLLDIN